MAQKGSKRIELTILGDKRQITAVVCGTLSDPITAKAIGLISLLFNIASS